MSQEQESRPEGISITGAMKNGYSEILSDEALAFLAELHNRFNSRRLELLQQRIARQKDIDAGNLPDFLESTRGIREDSDWQIAGVPADLQKRHVEITGPIERKMMINALNSGADVFMADCEDSNSPTWENIIDGQINLRDAVNRTITLESKGKSYRLNDETAVLLVRPRGWHLPEKHIILDDEPLSGSLVDFGLYFFHNAKTLLNNNSGPYFYLPKLEGHLEARLWNDVFNFAQDYLNVPRKTIKVTVLIENILAAFEMEEILYELRDHIVGLNAGRWDYIFSVIKKFRNQSGFLLPDRSQIGMTAPFMHAYTELLVKCCHKRGAHAIGGMSAFIPSRRDEAVNQAAISKVTADKQREANDGSDGTWVAHPDLVAVARQAFDPVLKGRPHQKERLREEVHISAVNLMNFKIDNGRISEDGVRLNINVAILYIESWLRGRGAAALYNLMEDAATAEISRAQLWQWIQHGGARIEDGRKVDAALYRELLPQELDKIKTLVGEEYFAGGKFDRAVNILNDLVLSDDFADFLTLPAYQYL